MKGGEDFKGKITPRQSKVLFLLLSISSTALSLSLSSKNDPLSHDFFLICDK